MEDTKPDEKKIPNSYTNKLIYLTGVLFGKVSNLKDNINISKATNKIKTTIEGLKRKTVSAANDFTQTATKMKESFVVGMESVNDETYKETQEIVPSQEPILPEKNDPPAGQYKTKSKSPEKVRSVVKSKRSTSSREISQDITADDVDQEIKKLDMQLQEALKE